MPAAGTSIVTAWPGLTSLTEVSGTSTVTCQVVDVRSAITGSGAAAPDPLAATPDCGPSGKSENSGRWVTGVPCGWAEESRTRAASAVSPGGPLEGATGRGGGA